MYKRFSKRLDVVECYLKGGISLHKTAEKYGVHYQSVYKWVKKYRKDGAEGLTNSYKRPWNRFSQSLEREIALLKERDPAITIRRAQVELRKQSIDISLKGIWQVWVRFGYAGFDKTRIGTDFLEYCQWTAEARHRFMQAKNFFERGDIGIAANILNTLPNLPHNSLLPQIPESLCNLQRRVEQRIMSFGKLPLPFYLKKMQTLYNECQSNDLHLTALRTGIAEIIGLSWGIMPDQQLRKTQELQKMLASRNDYRSNLLSIQEVVLMISEGISYAHRSEIDKALKIAQQCRRRLKRLSILSSELMVLLGTLYNQLENYREAGIWFERALDSAQDDAKGSIRMRLAEIYFLQGSYDESLKLVRKGKTQGWVHKTRIYFYEAMRSFMNGMPNRSIQLASEALSIARKEGLHWGLLKAYNAIASAYLSLGERKKAMYTIQRLIAYSKKLKRAESAFEILLSKKKCKEYKIWFDALPSTRLAILLKQGQYKKAYRLAQQKGMMAYLHRFIFYVPNNVRKLLDSGSNTGLPKKILCLPIFNQNVLVYRVKFLGNLILYRNYRYIHHQLPPKDAAFLVHLALRIPEPGNCLTLSSICDNFWMNTKDPEQNLYHALMRIKRVLKLPTHVLAVKRRLGESVIMNHSVFFISDFTEFEQVLSTANAFIRTKEWKFAKDDLRSAFRILRGLPFEKMYDSWSEDMRQMIINKIDRTTKIFIEGCPIALYIKDIQKHQRKICK